jgi:hypothetical protein
VPGHHRRRPVRLHPAARRVARRFLPGITQPQPALRPAPGLGVVPAAVPRWAPLPRSRVPGHRGPRIDHPDVGLVVPAACRPGDRCTHGSGGTGSGPARFGDRHRVLRHSLRRRPLGPHRRGGPDRRRAAGRCGPEHLLVERRPAQSDDDRAQGNDEPGRRMANPPGRRTGRDGVLPWRHVRPDRRTPGRIGKLLRRRLPGLALEQLRGR